MLTEGKPVDWEGVAGVAWGQAVPAEEEVIGTETHIPTDVARSLSLSLCLFLSLGSHRSVVGGALVLFAAEVPPHTLRIATLPPHCQRLCCAAAAPAARRQRTR